MSLGDYYKAWERRAKAMDDAAARPPPPPPDWKDLKPADIGVRFGAPLTAEQFAEYRKRRNVNVLGAAPTPPDPDPRQR